LLIERYLSIALIEKKCQNKYDNIVIKLNVRFCKLTRAESLMKTNKRIFISHSSKDNDVARIIVDALRGFDLDVWYDEDNLRFGLIRPLLEEPLATCQVFMVLLSQEALKSLWVNREIGTALTLEASSASILIVPALVRPCPVPPLLSGYRRLNFTVGDPVIELRKFVRLIDDRNIDRLSSPLADSNQTWDTVPRTPTAPPHISNSIGSISGGTIQVNQGETIHIANTGHYGMSSTTKNENIVHIDETFLSQFNILIEELSKGALSDQFINSNNLTSFLEMMATIAMQGTSLPEQLLNNVRTLCQHLHIVPLI
jgi:hypothetical protein